MNNVFKKKSCDQKVNGEKYNNSLCILEKSEMGTSTNFGHTIGNLFLSIFLEELQIFLL